MRKLLLALLLPVIVVSCQKNVDTQASNVLPEQTLKNISYGTDTAQHLDLYLPAGRSTDSTKVIVLVHGGAWSTGDKTDFNEYIPEIKRRLPRYAIININYRLAVSSTTLFPTQENDVQTALNTIASKKDEYHFNVNKLVLMGASAGGHLVLLQAYKHASPKIAAVVDLYGPTDLTDLYNNPPLTIVPYGLQSVIGGTPTTHAIIYQQSSPINFVTAQSPPTIIFHGTLDNLVPVSQSISLYTKLQGLGVISQLVIYPTEGHAYLGASLEDTFDKTQAFLNANVH